MDNFIRESGSIKRTGGKFQKSKLVITEAKNSIGEFNSKLDTAVGRISDLGNRLFRLSSLEYGAIKEWNIQ